MIKDKKQFKDRFINIFLQNGNKHTTEKFLNASLKIIQKQIKTPCKQFIQLSVAYLAPVFSVTHQKVKSRKRKVLKITPSFAFTRTIRTVLALKLLKKINVNAKKMRNETIAHIIGKEILQTLLFSSKSIIKKVDLHKQAIFNKRYLSKFKW